VGVTGTIGSHPSPAGKLMANGAIALGTDPDAGVRRVAATLAQPGKRAMTNATRLAIAWVQQGCIPFNRYRARRLHGYART